MTHMRQLSNRVKFGEEEDMTSDGMLGVGMLGKAQQTGKVRGGDGGGDGGRRIGDGGGYDCHGDASGGGGRVVALLTRAIVRRSASVRRSRSSSPSAIRRRGPPALQALPTASRRRLPSRPSRRVHTAHSHHTCSHRSFTPSVLAH